MCVAKKKRTKLEKLKPEVKIMSEKIIKEYARNYAIPQERHFDMFACQVRDVPLEDLEAFYEKIKNSGIEKPHNGPIPNNWTSNSNIVRMPKTMKLLVRELMTFLSDKRKQS